MISEKSVRSAYLASFPLIFSIFLLDQISKFAAARFGLVMACNKGIAFGLGGDVTFVAIAILILLGIFLLSQKENLSKVALAAIFGGGFSNVVDRVVFLCVRDFVKVAAFPAFNLADAAITVGVLILIYDVFKVSKT